MIEITSYGQSKGEATVKVAIVKMLLNGELTKSEDTALNIARLISGVQIKIYKEGKR